MYDEILDAWDAYLRPTSSSPLTIKKSPPSTRACVRGTLSTCACFHERFQHKARSHRWKREVRDADLGSIGMDGEC